MASISSDGFLTSGGITVNFQPWWKMGFRFTSLHLYEELGGLMANGRMELLFDGAKEDALTALTDQKTGTLTLKDEDGQILEIPIFVLNLDHDNNYATIDFVCLNSIDFMNLDITMVYDKPIKDVIKLLYPGKVDIREGCEPDIQNDPLYYQNKETNRELCTRLCYSYKKDCIFGYGLEGLLLKDTIGNKSSWNKVEPHLHIRVDTGDTMQREPFSHKRVKPDLYKLPIDLWKDTESKVAIKDYTDYESVNLKIMSKYRNRIYMHKDYYQLDYNLTYNKSYLDSKLYQEVSIISKTIPEFRLGDVLLYDPLQYMSSEIDLPWRQYLVRSNEIFLSVDNSDLVDEYGGKFGWTSKLLALEENGTIAIGSDSDPSEGIVVE
ncbi:MAG: hypothetical protein IJ880_15120 [Bacilli bacterium]|nr:hypothetical protein [Bacilli bacterium]